MFLFPGEGISYTLRGKGGIEEPWKEKHKTYEVDVMLEEKYGFRKVLDTFYRIRTTTTLEDFYYKNEVRIVLLLSQVMNGNRMSS